jgi:predicted CopG family antitoxin
MTTKTISLQLEAYLKLRDARQHPTESFSQVVLRARWPEETVTAREWLAMRRKGPHFSAEALRHIEELKAEQVPPEDKWRTWRPHS